MKEKFRYTTVTCISNTAEVIKINTSELLPKLKDESLKKLIQYAKSKVTICQNVVSSYSKFQSEQYIRDKKQK